MHGPCAVQDATSKARVSLQSLMCCEADSTCRAGQGASITGGGKRTSSMERGSSRGRMGPCSRDSSRNIARFMARCFSQVMLDARDCADGGILCLAWPPRLEGGGCTFLSPASACSVGPRLPHLRRSGFEVQVRTSLRQHVPSPLDCQGRTPYQLLRKTVAVCCAAEPCQEGRVPTRAGVHGGFSGSACTRYTRRALTMNTIRHPFHPTL